MNFIERHNSLAKIAQFIRQEKTGGSKEFARKCNLNSIDTLFNQIDILRQFAAIEDAEILYDKNRKTYYFSPSGKFTNFRFKEDN
jgi:hypothetical protein